MRAICGVIVFDLKIMTWPTPGGAGHRVSTEHLESKQFLSQVHQVAHGTKTGGLEVLHSLFLS